MNIAELTHGSAQEVADWLSSDCDGVFPEDTVAALVNALNRIAAQEKEINKLKDRLAKLEHHNNNPIQWGMGF